MAKKGNKMLKELEREILKTFWDYLHTITIYSKVEPNIPHQQVLFKRELPEIAQSILSHLKTNLKDWVVLDKVKMVELLAQVYTLKQHEKKILDPQLLADIVHTLSTKDIIKLKERNDG